MFNQFIKALKILSEGDRFNFYLINLFLLISVCLEFLSFSLIIPIISIIFKKDNTNTYLDRLDFLDTQNLNLILLIFFIIIILKLITLYYFEKKIHRTLYNIMIYLNKNIYLDLLDSNWDKITKKNISEITRITGGADVMLFVTQGIYNYMILIKNASIILGLSVFLIFVNFQATIIISIIFFVFTFIFAKFHGKTATAASVLVKELRDFKFKNMYETVNGLREIKLFGFADKIIKYYFLNEEKIADIQVKRRLVDILPKIFLELTFISILLIFIFIFQKKNLAALIPTISIYILVFARMLPLIVTFNTLIQRIKFANFNINETINLIQTGKNYKKFNNEKDLTNSRNNKIILNLDSILKFENVKFNYEDKLIFKNINMEFKTNKVIAITGKNGSGKSTFLDLLSSLIKPTSGSIKINETNINEYKSSWSKKIGYLSQSYFIFDDTLLKNIIFYDDKESLDKNLLDKALNISGVNEFMNDLPKGLDTNLGSMVKFLSGGQKQKIAIARVIYRNPEIFIFDEPTSSLDSESEDSFIEVLEKLKSKNKFIFLISHSKKLIDKCDEKFRIENQSIFKN